MKRVELLEALYLQGKKMRELQVYYFSLRKGGGSPLDFARGDSSPEAKKVLAQSKLEELQYDKMVAELDEWWEKCEEFNVDSESVFSTTLELTEVEIPDGWTKLVYNTSSETLRDMPENGFYVDVITLGGKMYKKVWFDMFFHCEDVGIEDDDYVIAWTYTDTTNDQDDDIRI